MSSDLAANKAAVAAHFVALNSGDYSTLASVHAASGRNHAHAPFDISEWPEEGVPFGPIEVQGTFEWLRSSVPDLVADVELLVAEDDNVIAWVKMSGTQSARLGAVAATGTHVEFHHAHRFRLADGLIVEHWAVRDDLRAMLQSGVVTPPGAPA